MGFFVKNQGLLVAWHSEHIACNVSNMQSIPNMWPVMLI